MDGPLGTVEDVTLAEARDKARECRRAVQAGQDPIADRKASRVAASGITFKDVAGLFIKSREAQWKNPVHRKQWATTLETYVYPTCGDHPIAAVETDDVKRILEPIWNTKPETAARVRGRIEAVLDYATASGWRKGDNPARLRGHITKLMGDRPRDSKAKHHAALPWAEMGGFMAGLRSQGGTAALALEFTILAAARTGETLGATWAEIDLDAAAWTVPGGRMKAGVEHRVALSPATLAVLAKVKPLGGVYVFPGAKPNAPLSNMTMLALLRRMDRGDLTVHGFRSTFRD